MRNVTIVNNTVYGHSTCVVVRWSGSSNINLANNALHCPGGAAVNGSGLTGSGLTIRSNHVEGTPCRPRTARASSRVATKPTGLATNPGWKVGPDFKQGGSSGSNRPAAPSKLSSNNSAFACATAVYPQKNATSVSCTCSQSVASTLPRLTY